MGPCARFEHHVMTPELKTMPEFWPTTQVFWPAAPQGAGAGRRELNSLPSLANRRSQRVTMSGAKFGTKRRPHERRFQDATVDVKLKTMAVGAAAVGSSAPRRSWAVLAPGRQAGQPAHLVRSDAQRPGGRGSGMVSRSRRSAHSEKWSEGYW